MRIKKLAFKVGPDATSAALSVSPKRITVFVGPNNGGKSAALREILHSLQHGQDMRVLFSSIEHDALTPEEINQIFEKFTLRDRPASSTENVMVGYRGAAAEMNPNQMRDLLSVATDRYHQYAYQTLLRHLVLNLGGENRLGMVSGASSQNLKSRPQSTIAELFVDDVLRRRVSEIVHDAFGQYLVIDPTSMGTLTYAFSDNLPSKELERSFGEDAVEFFSEAMPLHSASDGTKAFVGILTEVMAGSHDVLVIDEPEAFLHPALAQLLGREISRNLSKQKQMFVSTHSPHFLMGCISAGAPVDIVRLTYKSKKATARLLHASDLKRMMNDPLLKSIGVLGALFFEASVVVEADSDRAFYEEINNRLDTHGGAGLRHAAFLNAHGKHKAAHIARVLRNVGIPAALILDIDWIKEDAPVATRYLAAAGVPHGLREGLLATRRTVRKSLENTGKDYKANGGIALLNGAELSTAKSFFDQMENFGLFTVRGGELEHWLPDLGVVARKEVWLSKIFDAMGSDPGSEDYLKPNSGDVWALIRSVGDWVSNADRDGMSYVDPAELA